MKSCHLQSMLFVQILISSQGFSAAKKVERALLEIQYNTIQYNTIQYNTIQILITSNSGKLEREVKYLC